MKKHTKERRVAKVIKQLDKLKKEYPDAKICLEVPGKSVECCIKDALIYADCNYDLYIDGE